MNKTFDIKKAKRKKGRVTPAILPRSTGKTSAILNSMEDGDLCISPFNSIKDMVKARNSRYVISGRNMLTPQGWIYVNHSLFHTEIFGNGKFKTVYVDDFLYYPDEEIKTFINTVLQAADSSIIISSVFRFDDKVPQIFRGKDIYYDRIGTTQNIDLPDELFVL